MGKKRLLFMVTAIAMLFMFSFSVLAATTSTGYRYNSQYENVSLKYPKLASFSSGGTFAIPGLENTNVSGENCDCMVPQGICVFEDYLLITAYCGVEVYEDSLKGSLSSGDNAQKLQELKNHSSSGKPHNSVIYVLTKNSGRYVKTLVLSDDNHVGGIAYDGTYIWVAKSGDKQLSAILPSSVTSALSSPYESVAVEYYANVYCDCTASFVTTYNNMLWVGVFDKENSGTFCGYTLSGNTPETFELVAQKELVIPGKANGAALVDIGGETCLAVNSSYGRNNDTDVHLYSVDLQEDSNAANYSIYNKAILPPMAEDICIDNGVVYTLFESASTPYSCAEGNKCNNIVDRVIKAPLDEWFYWTDGNYTENEPEIKPDDNESPFAYEITNEADGRYVPNYIKTNDGVRMLYNPYSAEFALDLSVNAYKIGTDESWYNTLSKHGYTQFKRIENGVAFTVGNKKDSEGNLFSVLSGLNGAMAIKKLYYNGEIRYSIAVAFRGTNFKDIADVLTDISIVQSGGLHSGFSDAAKDFYNICKQVTFVIDGEKITVAEIISDMKKEDSKYSMFITGHSLGAAVADVFAGEVLTKQQGVYPGNVVAYTFAAPLHASSSYSYNYHNIYNIVNTDDIVTCISLTGAKRIGYDIFYSPDDEFRKEYYGTNYSEGHDTQWWVTDINAISTGFVAHDSNKVYRAIIMCKDEDIAKFAHYNTRTHNIWTETKVTIDKYCFGKISGNLTTKSLMFENGSLEVLGDVFVENGNSGTFRMVNEADYFLVCGNFKTSADNSYLRAGTIELKGDFSSLNWDSYNADENHNTIFSGNKMQTIRFECPNESNKFQNLYLKNQNVYFATPIQQLILQQDTELKNNSELSFDSYSGVLNLNGYSLKMNGSINAEDFYAYGGSAEITGDLNVGGTAILLATTCKVYGDFNLKGYLKFEKAHLEIFGDALVKGNGIVYTGTEYKYGLYMANPDDYFLIHGNFKVNSESDYLTAGTVEVKGDFTVEKTAWDNGFYQSEENHKTILSGDKRQTVYFGRNDSGALFTNLIIRNPDIYFASSIYQLVLCEDIEISTYNNLDIISTLDLNGHTFKMNGNVSAFEFNTNGGCLDLTGGIIVSKKTTVTGQNSKIIGDFTSGTTENNNSIEFEDNSLEIVGNMVVNYSTLYMSDDCYLLVRGDFVMSEYAESYLSNGTFEVKGNFTSKSKKGYNVCGAHKTIFSGNKKQTIYFKDPNLYNSFDTIIFQNKDISFISSVYQLRISDNMELMTDSDIEIIESLILYQGSLICHGNVSAKNLYIKSGSMVVNGDLFVASNSQFKNSNVKVSGDFSTSSLSTSVVEMGADGIEDEDLIETNCLLEVMENVIIAGNNSYMSTMQNEKDYLYVYGDFITNASYSDFTAGTVEVKGNFTSNSENGYYERGTHKTILSGSEKQIVYFEDFGEQNRFQSLILKNTSDDGVVFATDVYFAGPFKHNGCIFTLYNSGNNSVFLDSDYDGVLDPYDIFPTGVIAITELTVSDIEDVIFNSSAIKPEVIVSYNKTVLTKDTHYTVQYENNDKLGSAKAVITGLDDVEGSVTKSFNIVCAHKLENNTVKASLTQNGKIETKCSKCGEITSTETIYSPKTIKLSSTSVTYNGKTRSPSVIVKDSKGKTLVAGTDYDVTTPSGRKAPGQYTYTIKFKGNYEGEKKLTFTILPKAPTTISATQSTSVINLKWSSSVGATGYRVYQYSPSKKAYVQIASVKTTSYRKATNLKAGTEYKFKVKPYTKLSDGTVLWGTVSEAFATATECKAPKITSVTSPSKSKATVKWSNVDGETGYQLYYSTKKTSGFKKVDSYSANKLTGSKAFSSSASGKTIYFKVRAYKKVAGQTIYSEWSAVKSVKLK